jgi:hypothetical protein
MPHDAAREVALRARPDFQIDISGSLKPRGFSHTGLHEIGAVRAMEVCDINLAGANRVGAHEEAHAGCFQSVNFRRERFGLACGDQKINAFALQDDPQIGGAFGQRGNVIAQHAQPLAML